MSLLEIFRARCWARARLWSMGVIDLHEAVDKLSADAERDGIDIDTAQAILGEEFRAVRC